MTSQVLIELLRASVKGATQDTSVTEILMCIEKLSKLHAGTALYNVKQPGCKHDGLTWFNHELNGNSTYFSLSKLVEISKMPPWFMANLYNIISWGYKPTSNQI